jgi:hypothetical protein
MSIAKKAKEEKKIVDYQVLRAVLLKIYFFRKVSLCQMKQDDFNSH